MSEFFNLFRRAFDAGEARRILELTADVRDYGATGNPTQKPEKTTEALQRAVNAVGERKKRVFNPAAVVNLASNFFNILAHDFVSGDRVIYLAGGGTRMGGMSESRIYFIVNASRNAFQISTIPAGPAVNITSFGAGAAHSFHSGGGMVWLPNGFYEHTGIELTDFTVMFGQNPIGSRMRLANGANQHVVRTRGFDALAGSDVPPNQDWGPRSCGLMNLSIDGNAINQTSPKNGYSSYGISGILEKVEITNCSNNGWYSEISNDLYSVLVGQSLQGHFQNIKCHENNGGNIRYNGPSDTSIRDIRSYVCPTGGGIANVYVGPKSGGMQMTDCIFWAGGDFALQNDCDFAQYNHVDLDNGAIAALYCTATTYYNDGYIYDSTYETVPSGPNAILIDSGVGYNIISAKVRNRQNLLALGTSGGINRIQVESFNGDNASTLLTGTISALTDDIELRAHKPTPAYFRNKPGSWRFGGSIRPASYSVSGVPSAAGEGAGAIIYVANDSGGAVPAFSDGVNWRRVTDRAIVS